MSTVDLDAILENFDFNSDEIFPFSYKKPPFGTRKAVVYENTVIDISITDYVTKIIKQYGPISRNKIEELTGIPRTTIFEYITTRGENGLTKRDVYGNIIYVNGIKAKRRKTRRRGRPKTEYWIE